MGVFLNIAKKWPSMINHWEAVEKKMNERYRKLDNIRLKLNVVMVIYLSLSVGKKQCCYTLCTYIKSVVIF